MRSTLRPNGQERGTQTERDGRGSRGDAGGDDETRQGNKHRQRDAGRARTAREQRRRGETAKHGSGNDKGGRRTSRTTTRNTARRSQLREPWSNILDLVSDYLTCSVEGPVALLGGAGIWSRLAPSLLVTSKRLHVRLTAKYA